MKTILLNGCSFAEFWKPSDKFIGSLGGGDLINLGKAGTSFQRTCRSTIEWVAQNGSPDFVLIPITFAHRWELALNQDEDDIDGSWIPLQNSNFLSNDYRLQDSSINDVKKLVDQYYKIIPTLKTYWDKMFTEIITFSAFLEKQKINYLMWDMCNGFDKEHLNIHLKPYKAFRKIDLISQNPRIIDIWSFCGNRYMRDTMPEDVKKDTPEFAHHHKSEQYIHLEQYITNYLNTLK
jgi:hypothetical protein